MRTNSALIIAAGFVASIAPLVMGACGSKPTEEDCIKFADNYVKQMSAGQQEGPAADITRQVGEGMRPDLLKDCNEHGNKVEVDCAIKATTMKELQQCALDAKAR